MKTTRKKLVKKIHAVCNSKTNFNYIAFWKNGAGWNYFCGYNIKEDFDGARDRTGCLEASVMHRNDKTTYHEIAAAVSYWRNPPKCVEKSEAIKCF